MKIKLLLFLFTTVLISCKKSNSNPINEGVNKQITLKQLDSINSLSINDIKGYLKLKDYTLLEELSGSEQWNKKDDIIQFNNTGVLVLLTYDNSLFNQFIKDLKSSEYKYTGASEKNGINVDSYSVENQTIFISEMNNPENNRKVYSFTFIN